jgi:hypothetical protein
MLVNMRDWRRISRIEYVACIDGYAIQIDPPAILSLRLAKRNTVSCLRSTDMHRLDSISANCSSDERRRATCRVLTCSVQCSLQLAILIARQIQLL